MHQRGLSLILLLTLILTGCTVGSYVISVGRLNLRSDRITGEYQSFHGYRARALRLQAGQTLMVHGTVETKGGELTIKLVDPNGQTLWTSLDGATQLDAQIRIPETGRYWVRVEGEKHKGGVNLSYQAK